MIPEAGSASDQCSQWNLLIPSGSGQSVNNICLTYDLKRKRWYQKKISVEYPQLGFVVRDERGVTYQYLTTDDGIMHRGEYGSTWNGATITHLVRMSDHIPTENIFDESTIHALRVLHQVPDFDTTSESITFNIKHYLNGGEQETTLDSFVIQRSDLIKEYNLVTEAGEKVKTEAGEYIILEVLGSERYVVHHKGVDLQGLSHQFEFSRDSDSYSYLGNFSKRLLGFGYTADLSRAVQ